jgi:hypothetical protein
MKRIPPQVSLRGVRLSQGLTAKMLAEQIAERGVTVDHRSIFNVEAGNTGASNELLVAWAEVLKLNPRDVRVDADMRELVAEVDAEDAA